MPRPRTVTPQPLCAPPEAQRLNEAVAAYSNKQGINAATIGVITQKFVGLLASRWEHICDVALAEENEGRVNVGFRVAFDMTRKIPCGNVSMSFSKRTRDDADFQVEDPDQATLPFARRATPVPSPTGAPLTPPTPQPATGAPASPVSSPLTAPGSPLPPPPVRRRRSIRPQAPEVIAPLPTA